MNGPARIYCDHAATTPVRPEVLDAMLPHLGADGFNPSSTHAEGRRARAALDAAREEVALALGVQPREIVFTGGGSEADNLAVIGAAHALRPRGRHVLTSAVEHDAVLRAFEALRDEGYEVEVLPVDAGGVLAPQRFAAALRADTTLASVMLANNEIGTLQEIGELARIARRAGVVFHTDAVQAPGRVPLRPGDLGVDLLSLAAHKFYGPKGVGALYVRAQTPLEAQLVGGGQERGLRSGTENVAGIAGLARALALAVQEQPAEARRLRALRERFEARLEREVGGVHVHAAGAPRLPNISSVAFRGADAEALLVGLDLAGAAVSLGSACSSGGTRRSHVLDAIGARPAAEAGTVRFSFGRLTGEQELDGLVRMVGMVAQSVRDPGAFLGTASRGSYVTGLSEGNV